MRKSLWSGSAKSVRPNGPPTVEQKEVLAGAAAEVAARVVCYCGLYAKCPVWSQMSVEGRRACSADKRMTAEYFWRHGLAGA